MSLGPLIAELRLLEDAWDDAHPEGWDACPPGHEFHHDLNKCLPIKGPPQPVDKSNHPTVVEYAFHEIVKKKATFKTVAARVAEKFNGSTNMFFGDGIVQIDPKKLEDAMWDRVAEVALKHVKKGADSVDGALQQYHLMDLWYPKGEPAGVKKIRKDVEARVAKKLGHNPFEKSPQSASTPAPPATSAATATLTPNQYHQKHGKCPEGYHYNPVTRSCEKAQGVHRNESTTPLRQRIEALRKAAKKNKVLLGGDEEDEDESGSC